MASAARFFAKVYSRTGGTFKRTLDAGLWLDVPRIVREVGKPASEMTITLALPWDDFDYPTTIAEGFLVKVYALDDDANVAGTLVYQGHIVDIKGVLSKSSNHVELRLFPIDAMLDQAFWKSGAGETLANYTVSYAAADIDTMFTDAVSDLNTVFGATFFTASLGNPGKSITADIVVEATHLSGLEKAALFLDSDWYWRIHPDGTVKLGEYADVTPTHVFTLDLHVDSVEVTKSVVDVKNGIRLEYTGPAYAFYNDATSETAYGKKQYKITDSGIGNVGSANEVGNSGIARLKDSKTATIVVVNAEYDIASILPGDTCEFRNISDETSQMLSGVLRIHRVEYDGATAILHLADVVSNFGREFGMAIAA